MNGSWDNRREFLATSLSAAVLVGLNSRGLQAQETKSAGLSSGKGEELIAKGVRFLKARQESDGGWSSAKGPGVTALVTTALLRSKLATAGEPSVAKAIAHLESKIGPNGGFDEGGQANYVTSISLMALKEANAGGKYSAVIKRGQNFLKDLQWGEGKGKDQKSDFYGGAGYRGDKSRPDLSNTAFMIETLRETGLSADDPNLKKALLFISRCQNEKTEFNDQPWAGKVKDGGFIYSAANGGESKAGGDPNEGLRSYGSMTYAGFKSMIHAGLTPDDPRVKAAMRYIRNNYTLDENPGMGQIGLYYYYQTFAKTMAMLGQPTFTDAKGKAHDWRTELVEALAKRQTPDGAWVNPADRFMEGDPNLVTSYGLLALTYARAKS